MTIRAFSGSSDSTGPSASILLDCFCESCGRHITLDELQSDFHREHHFSTIEMAALQAMRAYLRFCDPAIGKVEFPHS